MENNEHESELNETRNEDKNRLVKKFESISSDVSVPSNRFWKVFALITGIATLISIPLAFYFWLDSKIYSDITFTVHPVKEVLLRNGQTSKLTVAYDNKPIETDVSRVQMAIWNNGKKSVRNNEILSVNNSIEIMSVNRIPILEAQIKSSRDVVQCQLNTERMEEGFLSLSWRILEKRDSCVIRVIYAGNTLEDYTATGTFEEQSEISLFSASGKKNSIQTLLSVFATIFAVLTIFSILEVYIRFGEKGTLKYSIISLAGVLYLVLFFIYSESLTKDTLPFTFQTL